MKRIIGLIIIFGIIFSISVSAKEGVTVSSESDISDINVPIETSAENTVIGQKLDIKAKSAVLMEVNTGEILYSDNADEELPPASITKIMPLLLVMEALDRGDISLETVVYASEHACSMAVRKFGLNRERV